MQLQFIDYLIFAGVIVAVVSIGILGSRHEKDSESNFPAGRGRPWWLIGFSLIAANISTERFVGMSGAAADRFGLVITAFKPLAQPVQLATSSDIDMTPSKGAKALAGVVVLLTIALYIVFW